MKIKNIFKRKKVVKEANINKIDIYKQQLEKRKEKETIMGDVTNPIYLKYLTNACNMIDEVIAKLVYLNEEEKKLEIYNLEIEYSKNLELFSRELYDSMPIDDSLRSTIDLQKFVLLPYIRSFRLNYMCDLYEYYLEDKRLIENKMNTGLKKVKTTDLKS